MTMETHAKARHDGAPASPGGIISGALADAAHAPGMLLALYLLNLAATAAGWFLLSQSLAPALAGRPEPDLFHWVVLTRTNEPLTLTLLANLLVVAGVYLLFNALVAGAVLERLGGGDATPGALRHLARLMAMRVLVGLPVLGLAALWFHTGRWLWPLSLALVDDRGPLLAQAALGLVLAAPLAWLLMVQHYAQALVARSFGPLRAMAGAARQLWRAPLTCLVAWLCCWLAWGAVTVIFGLAQVEQPLVAQIAVAVRVFIHIWSLAAARRVMADYPSAIRS